MKKNGQGPQKRETEFHGTKKPGQFGERDERAASAVELKVAGRDVTHVDADLETVDAQIDELTARRAALCLEALALSAREKFEDAQTIHFQHTPFHESGLTLVAVTDRGRDSVWDLQDLTVNGEYEAAREWQQSLSKYTRGIDRESKALTEVKHYGVDFDLCNVFDSESAD